MESGEFHGEPVGRLGGGESPHASSYPALQGMPERNLLAVWFTATIAHGCFLQCGTTSQLDYPEDLYLSVICGSPSYRQQAVLACRLGSQLGTKKARLRRVRLFEIQSVQIENRSGPALGRHFFDIGRDIGLMSAFG